ncbi:hypothetical protein BH09BAC1_BH09BAC1_08160 [soil metagenome]
MIYKSQRWRNIAIFIMIKPLAMMHFNEFAKQILLIGIALISLTLSAQTELRVDGRTLKQADGTSIVLRGVNSGIAEDGNYDLADLNACKNYIDQIAMSGANTIRFTWYTDGVSWRDGGQYVAGNATPEARYHKGNGTVMRDFISNGHLSNIFSYCKTKGIIPVLAIHDLTCANDWTYFNNDLKTWWTKPTVVALINAHKDHLIINIANEMGVVRWNGGTANDFNAFKTNYGSMMVALRNAGINVPIMIDAPDCGQSISELMTMSADLLNADPQHNVIFSTHLYWGGYAATPNDIAAKFTEAVNANICLALGEVAPNQDNGSCGNMDITAIYQSALAQACPLGINWYAWSWDQDCSPARNMTTNGNYNTLSTFGSDIVNNASYGLKSANCGASPVVTSIGELGTAVNPLLQWSSATGTATFHHNGTYTLYNLHGQLLQQNTVEANSAHTLDMATIGIYLLHFEDANGKQQVVKVVR